MAIFRKFGVLVGIDWCCIFLGRVVVIFVDRFMISGVWVMSTLRICGRIWSKSAVLSILYHGNASGELWWRWIIAMVRTATPQLYVSSWCCVILGVWTAEKRARSVSSMLLMRLNIASLCSRVVISIGRGGDRLIVAWSDLVG